MSKTFQALTEQVHVNRARKAQLKAIVEALGGAKEGWVGFTSSEEVLSYLRDNDPNYKNVQNVGQLVEKLGLTNILREYSAPILEAARASEKNELKRLDETIKGRKAV